MTTQQLLNQIKQLQQDNATLTQRLSQVEKDITSLKTKKKKAKLSPPPSE